MNETNRRLEKIEELVSNHLSDVAKEFKCITKKITRLETDSGWIKKIQWFMLTTLIGILVSVAILFLTR